MIFFIKAIVTVWMFNSMSFQNVSKSSFKEPLTMSAMKRDTSRIFTVPEEGELDSTNYPPAPQYVSSVPLAMNHVSPIRRKQESKPERPKISGTVVNPLTPSVCATPLKDIDRVLHGNAMLICSSESGGETDEHRTSSKSNDDDDIPDVVKEALRYIYFYTSLEIYIFIEQKFLYNNSILIV